MNTRRRSKAVPTMHMHRHRWKPVRSYPQQDGTLDKLYHCTKCHSQNYKRGVSRWKE